MRTDEDELRPKGAVGVSIGLKKKHLTPLEITLTLTSLIAGSIVCASLVKSIKNTITN